MGSLSGRILSELVQGLEPTIYPNAIQFPLSKFPFGSARRLIIPPVYSWFKLVDL
jgi:hypothetical protein